MQFKRFLTDDDAVSPVIGVILMVAITVILAAVIASFVLGLGPGETAPTASFDIEDNGDSGIDVTHTQGDKIGVDNIEVQSDHDDVSTSDDWGDDSEISSGDTYTLTYSDSDISEDGEEVEVSIIWESGDTSNEIDSATVTVTGTDTS